MNKNNPIKKTYLKPFWYYSLGGLIIWTLFVCFALFWHLRGMHLGNILSAKIEARNVFQNHVIYREWNARHGGVYVPITPETQPNPYLDISDRDIESTTGLKLTLINPSLMTRQANELAKKQFEYVGHITSLNPIRPENQADEWEMAALKQFETGVKEVATISMIENKEYMRLMRPLITEAGCLKCHEKQGYKIGQIRGGISVAVPMQPYYFIESENKKLFAYLYGLLWLIGLSGTFLFMFVLNRQVQKRLQAEEALRQRDKLDGVIEMARAVCHELNQPLQTIMGNTEILMMDNIDTETLKKRIKYIKDQVDRMGKMTGKLIKIANYETIDMPQGKVIDIEKSTGKSKKS